MPSDIVSLIQTAKRAADLFRRLEQGDFASSLGDIEIKAARTALAELPLSTDKRSQVWTCIGHVNSAQAAYEHAILSRTPGNVSHVRGKRDDILNAKRRCVLILKSICYKYVGENILYKQAKEQASQEFRNYQTVDKVAIAVWLPVFGVFDFVLGPTYCFATGMYEELSRYEVDGASTMKLYEMLDERE